MQNLLDFEHTETMITLLLPVLRHQCSDNERSAISLVSKQILEIVNQLRKPIVLVSNMASVFLFSFVCLINQIV